jgi:tetratricopeptide (TPR) repeat protein
MISVDDAMQLATQQQGAGNLAQAEHIVQRILEAAPTHAHARHLLGIIAYQAGKIDTAIQCIEQAIASDPHVAIFHSNLGEMQRLVKALPISIQHGERAVALDPHAATGWSNLGVAYYDAQDYERALTCHQRALTIDPQLLCSLNNLGSVYKALGHTQQAMTYYRAAITVSPNFVDSLNNMAVLLLEEQAFTQAHIYLNQILALAPTFAEAHCNMGFALVGLERLDNARYYFEQALALKPDYAEAYYGFAKIYLLWQHFIEAEHAIRKALQLQPHSLEFYQCLASIYHDQGKSLQALEYLEKALAIDNKHTSLYLSQGLIWTDLGDIPQAEAVFSKAASDPCVATRIDAHYSLVQLQKIKADHPSFQALLALTSDIPAVPPKQLAYLYFALGKCYEDLREWSQAFEFFSQGCQAKRAKIAYDTEKPMTLVHKIIQGFTPKIIESLRQYANPSALPIFIVGMPRSGTTLIEQIISSHPQVYGAGELRYWNDLLDTPVQTNLATHYYPDNIVYGSPDICQTIAKKYLSHLRRCSTEAARITDKMPYNYIAMGVIHALLPNATIIHVKRNPLDTCLSCYTKLFTQGQHYSYDLTELGHYYRCYEQIMAHWRQLLPEGTWLDIAYEDVVGNLEAEAQRLIAFCGLPWDPACLDFHQTNRSVRTASFAQVRQPVYTSSVGRWHHYERELAPLIEVLG